MALRRSPQGSDTHILEITLISAQDLKKSNTYAVLWINPSFKLRTHVDHAGGESPTWNDKFLFRVSTSFLSSDSSSAVHIEIYALGYVVDSLLGSVRFLVGNQRLLLGNGGDDSGFGVGVPSFSAVWIRRPSGRFQGVLNIGSTLLSYRQVSMVAKEELDRCGAATVGIRRLTGENDDPKFWRRRVPSMPSLTTEKKQLPPLKDRNRDENDENGSTSDSASFSSRNDPGNGGSAAGGSCERKGWFGRKIHLSASDQNLQRMDGDSVGRR